jgi:UDP-glucuronate decarboxylase
VHGAINMLGLAKRLNARIFQASTSEVYGDPEMHPQHESYWGRVNPIGPRACYDEGKRCAETLFFDYQRQHNMDIKVVRIFNTYGPRMHPNDGRVVSNFIVQALRGATSPSMAMAGRHVPSAMWMIWWKALFA